METNRAILRALWWISVAALTLAIFTLAVAASVRFAATSTWWWERGFERYEAPRRSGLPAEEVSRIGAEVRDYLRNEDERLTVQRPSGSGGQVPVFSEREVAHMVDVKWLMGRVWDAGWAAFGYIVAFASVLLWRRRRAGLADILGAAATSGSVIVTLVVVLAIVAVSGFDEAFRQFHLLFFTNDLWQLTRADALIQLFPQRFFFDTTMLIGASILVPSVLLGATGWWIGRRA